MAVAFVGQVKSFRSDDEGQCVISFTVDPTNKAEVTKVSDLTRRNLFITVMEEQEVEQA